MADPAVAALLTQAEAALHNLKIGALASEVQVDGRLVKYTRTDIDKLEGYVAELRQRATGRPRRNGGIGFIL